MWKDFKQYPILYLTEIYINLFELFLISLIIKLSGIVFILAVIGLLFYTISKSENRFQKEEKLKIKKAKIDSVEYTNKLKDVIPFSKRMGRYNNGKKMNLLYTHLVIIFYDGVGTKENRPFPVVTGFHNYEEAKEFFDKASWQWSESFLVNVLKGPIDTMELNK